MATTSGYRAAAIVADILKIIPTLAFGEIAGLVAYLGEQHSRVPFAPLLYAGVAGLMISGILSLIGLSLFVQPLSDEKNPIHHPGVRISTVASFWILVTASAISLVVLAIGVFTSGSSEVRPQANKPAIEHSK